MISDSQSGVSHDLTYGFPSLGSCVLANKTQTSSYTVDKVYGPDAQTDTLYRDLVGPLVPWAWNGGVGTLFAYGQTSSGKTHTVSELERLVASTLMDGRLDGTRNFHFCAFELAGNTAYGMGLTLLLTAPHILILTDY
jgi:hypothetical protein